VDLFTPIVRSSDPETSHEAANRILPKRGTDAARVYAWFLANPRGATAKEYSAWTKHEGGWKRCSDLIAKGLLRETGEVRDGGRVLVALDG
jgi:hypothetical protein